MKRLGSYVSFGTFGLPTGFVSPSAIFMSPTFFDPLEMSSNFRHFFRLIGFSGSSSAKSSITRPRKAIRRVRPETPHRNKRKMKKMGDFIKLSDRFDHAKRNLWFTGKGKEVIDVDAKTPVDPSFQPSISSGVTELRRMKVEKSEKILLYKEWMESAKWLKFRIDLHKERWSTLCLLSKVVVSQEAFIPLTKEEAFIPLTKEEENEVDRAFSPANRGRVLATHQNSSIVITGEIMQCLKPGAWLNDEVINLYMELLKERERRDPKRFLQCHFFNTFFYKKLISGKDGYDFKSVSEWTKKLGYGLIDCDKIFIPIHKETHWCLAVINKKDEKLQYLDSLGGTDSQVLTKLARYFVDEVKDKSGKDIDISSWKQKIVEHLPEQQNGSDCGMFMIKCADFYSRGGELCFNQDNMPYFRQRTAKEILRLKAD